MDVDELIRTIEVETNFSTPSPAHHPDLNHETLLTIQSFNDKLIEIKNKDNECAADIENIKNERNEDFKVEQKNIETNEKKSEVVKNDNGKVESEDKIKGDLQSDLVTQAVADISANQYDLSSFLDALRISKNENNRERGGVSRHIPATTADWRQPRPQPHTQPHPQPEPESSARSAGAKAVRTYTRDDLKDAFRTMVDQGAIDTVYLRALEPPPDKPPRTFVQPPPKPPRSFKASYGTSLIAPTQSNLSKSLNDLSHTTPPPTPTPLSPTTSDEPHTPTADDETLLNARGGRGKFFSTLRGKISTLKKKTPRTKSLYIGPPRDFRRLNSATDSEPGEALGETIGEDLGNDNLSLLQQGGKVNVIGEVNKAMEVEDDEVNLRTEEDVREKQEEKVNVEILVEVEQEQNPEEEVDVVKVDEECFDSYIKHTRGDEKGDTRRQNTENNGSDDEGSHIDVLN